MVWFQWFNKPRKSLDRIASKFSAKSKRSSCNSCHSRTSDNVSEKDSQELTKSPKQIASKVSVKQLEKMFLDLECPCCHQTCVPPIETCKNGHLICPKCRPLTATCRTCGEPFAGSRNAFAENFILQYGKPCRFKDQGCSYLRWKGEKMAGHENVCEYRNVDCFVPFCGRNLPFRSLLEHMQQEHGIAGGDKLPTVISYEVNEPITSSRKWLPYYVESFGQVFFLMLEVVRPSFYIWVWVQELQKDHFQEFIYAVSLKLMGGCNGIVHKWQGPVHNMRTSAETIKKDGLCFIIAECAMQHFERNGKISLAVNVTKKLVNKDMSDQQMIIAPLPTKVERSTVALNRELAQAIGGKKRGKNEFEESKESPKPTAPCIYPNCGDFTGMDSIVIDSDVNVVEVSF